MSCVCFHPNLDYKGIKGSSWSLSFRRSASVMSRQTLSSVFSREAPKFPVLCMFLETWRPASAAVLSGVFGCEVSPKKTRFGCACNDAMLQEYNFSGKQWCQTDPSHCPLCLFLTGRNDSGEENVPLDLTRGKQRLHHTESDYCSKWMRSFFLQRLVWWSESTFSPCFSTFAGALFSLGALSVSAGDIASRIIITGGSELTN